jgi:hypothetical protein
MELDHSNATLGTGIYNANGNISSADLANAEFAVRGRAIAQNVVGVLGSTSGHNSQVAVDAVGNTGLGEGIAVRARTLNGIALYGQATGGYGLQVVGRAVFNRSGKTTVAANQSTKVVSGFAITPATIVVATVQGGAARYVRNVVLNDAADTFTIRLNKVEPSGGVVVGFFIVN